MTNMLPTSIIVADDHSMVRKGITLLLTARLKCKHVAEAATCNALMNELKKGGVTHVILDVIFPDGTSLEVVPIIRNLYPAIRIMIFSMQPVDIYASAFRQYGIQYYLSKAANEEDTVGTIKRFLDNEPDLSQPIQAAGSNTNPFSMLAPRELEILHYLLNGHKTSDIAKNLNLGNSTVSTLKARIFEKTQTTSLAQLFEIAQLNNFNFLVNTPKYTGSE